MSRVSPRNSKFQAPSPRMPIRRLPAKTAPRRPDGSSGALLRPALEDPERTRALFIERLQWMVFALVPLFAGWLRLLYRRRERFFVPHLVFALHFHALAFLLLVAGTAGTLILGIQIVSAIAYLVVVAMLFLSLRRVYAEGVLKTLAKQFALLFAHLVAVNLGLLALFILTGLTAQSPESDRRGRRRAAPDRLPEVPPPVGLQPRLGLRDSPACGWRCRSEAPTGRTGRRSRCRALSTRSWSSSHAVPLDP